MSKEQKRDMFGMQYFRFGDYLKIAIYVLKQFIKAFLNSCGIENPGHGRVTQQYIK